MATPTQKTNTQVSQSNQSCFDTVAFWKNWKNDTTVMKIVKLIGTLLIFPLLIAGTFDIVKKGYDFVWKKPEEKIEIPNKTLEAGFIKRQMQKVKDGCSYSYNKVSNVWTNHRKAIYVGTGTLVAVAALAWFVGPCKITAGYYGCPTSQANSAPAKTPA